MLKQFKLAPIAALSCALFSAASTAAVYQINEIQTSTIALNGFSSGINAAGDVAIIVQTPYNPPIDLELIDFDALYFQENLTDIDAARNGNFNAEDYQLISDYVKGLGSSLQAQKLAVYQSYTYESGVLQFEPGLDEIDDDLGGYTQSTETEIQAINDAGVTVGNSEGRRYKVYYTNEDGDDLTYMVQDYGKRAFVNLNGTIVGLESETDLVGGYTEAYDINNGLLVAGAEMIDPSDSLQEAVDNCNDDETRGDVPVEVCLQFIINSSPQNTHQIRGMLWQLDQQGNVIEKTQLGLPIDVAEDDTSRFYSRAVSVNENGVAVGLASDYYQEDEELKSIYPVMFANGEVKTLIDTNVYFDGLAVDINNEGLIVGYGKREVNGANRNKFFVYDSNTDEVVFPDDFFTGANTNPRAINDMGLVVGESDYDTSSNASLRRKHAFVYDVNEDTFLDLNDLVSCESPYTIVQANDINDAGQISATAVTSKPLLDITGEPVLDDAGEVINIDVIASVVLEPIPGGTADSCEPPASENRERQGGSLSFWYFALLGGLVATRRRSIK